MVAERRSLKHETIWKDVQSFYWEILHEWHFYLVCFFPTLSYMVSGIDMLRRRELSESLSNTACRNAFCRSMDCCRMLRTMTKTTGRVPLGTSWHYE